MTPSNLVLVASGNRGSLVIPAEIRIARGVDDSLVRLSVGIEDVADLQEDLRQAMA